MNTSEALDQLRRGKKVRVESWEDGSYIQQNKLTREIVDENGQEINASVLVDNNLETWEVV